MSSLTRGTVKVDIRRDLASNFTNTNPTLKAGEPAFETDTKKLKVGDGSTAWTSLAYVTDVSLPLSGGTMTGNVNFNDAVKLLLGSVGGAGFIRGTDDIEIIGTRDVIIDVVRSIILQADTLVSMGDGTNTIFAFDTAEPSLTIHDDADQDDYFKIVVAANGVSTISTNSDAGIAPAHLYLSPDGDINLTPFTDTTTIHSTSGSNKVITLDGTSTRKHKFYSAADNLDWMQIEVSASGATSLTTVDDGAAVAHLDLVADGNVAIKCNPGGTIKVVENDNTIFVPSDDADIATKKYVDDNGLKTASVTLSAAQCTALHSTAITLVPAQGAGLVVLVQEVVLFIDRAATQANAGCDLFISYGGTTSLSGSVIKYKRRFMNGVTGDRILTLAPYTGTTGISLTEGDNANVAVKVDSAITSGCITSMKCVVRYYVYDNS